MLLYICNTAGDNASYYLYSLLLIYINMKTKTNAVEIYMGSHEVRTILTGNNLNLRDEIKEKIEALEELQ